MKKIFFDDVMIESIRNFINEGHSKKETCNRFSIKLDTLNRVMFENNINPYYINKQNNIVCTDEDATLVCSLFSTTKMRLQDICKEAKIPYYVMTNILESNFSKYEIEHRKSVLYSDSKKAEKNFMFGKKNEKHPNYVGIIEDGSGYLIALKPSWYTGRKNSKYVYVHHIVFCEHMGLSQIPSGFVIHHIDGNKKNNDISNLALMSISAHSKLHQMQIKMCKVQRLSNNGVGVKSETPNNN